MATQLKIALLVLLSVMAIYWQNGPEKTVSESISVSKIEKVATSTPPNATKSSVFNETVLVAKKYNLDQERFSQVIFCESGYNPNAWNKSDPYGGSRGVGQFLQRTFDHYKILAGLPNGDVWNYKDAVEVAGYMWSKGEQHQWSVWRIMFGDMQYMEAEKKHCDKEYKKMLEGLKTVHN